MLVLTYTGYLVDILNLLKNPIILVLLISVISWVVFYFLIKNDKIVKWGNLTGWVILLFINNSPLLRESQKLPKNIVLGIMLGMAMSLIKIKRPQKKSFLDE